MVNDISRAYFHAKAGEESYVELLEEGKTEEHKAQDNVGMLRFALYGTREAAVAWQREVAKHLASAGFTQGVHNSSVNYTLSDKLERLCTETTTSRQAFGNNYSGCKSFLNLGTKTASRLKCYLPLESEKEVSVLNRIIRWTNAGIEIEADPRHAEILIRDTNVSNKRTLNIAGKEYTKEDEVSPTLSTQEASRYRSMAARANYLAQDRPEIAYSVKELCRRMATLKEADKVHFNRLAQYVNGHKRLVQLLKFQAGPIEAVGDSDSDWAGCKITRKSTSGGCVLIGNHFIKGWSKTQNVIALSSAEAELTGIVKTTCECLGIMALAKDLGIILDGTVRTDASAALAIASRTGAGRVKHLDTQLLWIQQKEARENVKFAKVHTHNNPADMWTKNLDVRLRNKHLEFIGMSFQEGRAEAAIELNVCKGSGRRIEA